MWKNRRGFSLIEVIITIALVSVLIGSAVAMFGHIRYADTKKVAEQVNIALSDLRLHTMSMSQERKQYLYIYRWSDSYYMKVTYAGKDDVVLNAASAMRLCGNNVTLYADGEPVEGETIIYVAYKKNGLFADGITQLITIEGAGTYTIHLDGVAGRHY